MSSLITASSAVPPGSLVTGNWPACASAISRAGGTVGAMLARNPAEATTSPLLGWKITACVSPREATWLYKYDANSFASPKNTVPFCDKSLAIAKASTRISLSCSARYPCAT